MAISYKLEQLSKEIHDITRREHNMASAIAILDNKHSENADLILMTTGDDISLLFIATNALHEVMKQSGISKRKILRCASAGIDFFNEKEHEDE